MDSDVRPTETSHAVDGKRSLWVAN